MSTLTHPYPSAPTGLSRYASDASTPCPPSPILTPLNAHFLSCLRSCRTLKICLRHCHPMSALTHPYASTPPPLTMLALPQDPQDMPPSPEPHLHSHPFIHLCTPALSSLLLSIHMLLY
ncbi:hypothetical protein O181_038382 [Austropuccinia psidii MF-1]|uniref:Uncharacterized protein n=1 Tax=Austropuccinia psidii MF-1 TaxID=1389203 RepID=A0A9Q3DAU1_9BASI|nr:hypothetical protein [Austropuccinia psidii MF-1]